MPRLIIISLHRAPGVQKIPECLLTFSFVQNLRKMHLFATIFNPKNPLDVSYCLACASIREDKTYLLYRRTSI